MNKIIIVIVSALFLVSCFSEKKNTDENKYDMKAYLTNNSIKFWETYSSFVAPMCIGLYLSSDFTCDEYSVDEKGNRQCYFYGDIIMERPFTYKLSKDSLIIYIKGCELDRCKRYKFRINKLTTNRMDVQFMIENKLCFRSYYAAKDQKTKPKFWYELYPNDKSKWPYGTY
ncbi:MAG: hypothetical protein Q8861_13695 [Bacteroidota bacterium]|nr:hypothetical protein [Bacteroidota bacterium]